MTQDLVYEQIPISFGFYTKKTFSNFIVGNNLDMYSSLLNIRHENQLMLIYGPKASISPSSFIRCFGNSAF